MQKKLCKLNCSYGKVSHALKGAEHSELLWNVFSSNLYVRWVAITLRAFVNTLTFLKIVLSIASEIKKCDWYVEKFLKKRIKGGGLN